MKPSTRRTLFLGAFGALFLAGFGWVVVTQGPLAAVKVTTATVAETTLERTLFGIGTVEARRAYAIGPTAAGRIARVLVDQGDIVEAGRLLAEMEPVDLDARLAAGTASAASAAQRVLAAEAALAESRSRATLAQASAARFADLHKKNFFSQEAADAKAHEATAALSARAAAAAALAAAREDVRRAQSELAGTGKSRTHLRLTSPVDGIVSARLAEPGSTVVAGQSVLQVIDPASLWVKVRIDQGRSDGLTLGLPARIVLRSRPGQSFSGRVTRVDLVGDAVTEERIANVSLDAAPESLAIGELAEVTLTLSPLERTLAVPAAALVRHGTALGVWTPADGRARFVPVKPGATSRDGLTEIRAGLSANATVIVYSGRALTPEARITVVDSLVKTAR